MNRRSHTAAILAFALATSASLVGCAQRPTGPFASAEGERPETIRHIVLVDLIDAADAPALISAMDAGIAKIPGIVHYWRGTPFESNRPEVKGAYDVALILDFRDPAAYDAYVVDERHKTLVRTWMPKATSLTIYDVNPCATRK